MLGFPSATRPEGGHFRRNLLKSVTFQIKFQRNTEIVEVFKDKKDSLKTKFPIASPITFSTTHISFKDKTPIIQTASSSNCGYQFKTINNDKTLAITEDTFTYTISGPTYQNFYETISEIKSDFFPILEECNVTNCSRIAIRKINLVEPKDPAYSSDSLFALAFNKNLVHNFSVFPDKKCITSGITNVTLEKDDKRLNLIYGILSPNPKKKQILLDIDLFLINQNVGLELIESTLAEINTEIFNIFSWALSEEMKADISN
ncbi:MAG: TIGR04255 family protein [Nitrospirales bacterium]